MTRQDGYTAAEALAALAILGLAMGGLTTSMHIITRGQTKAQSRLQQAMWERAVDQQLERLLSQAAPFRSDQASRLTGDGQAFQVDCGAGQHCVARIEAATLTIQGGDGRSTTLRLPDGQGAHFVYVGSHSTSDTWPPAALPPPAPSWQTLSAVMIQSRLEDQDKPLAMAKVWRQQRADCEYDVVIQDCRGSAS